MARSSKEQAKSIVASWFLSHHVNTNKLAEDQSIKAGHEHKASNIPPSRPLEDPQTVATDTYAVLSGCYCGRAYLEDHIE